MAYDTTALLSDIRRLAGLPSSTPTGTDDVSLLATADMCMRSWLVPELHSVNEEYYVREFSISAASGVSRLRVPSRSVGSGIRSIAVQTSNSSLYSLERIEPERKPQFIALTSGVGQPWGYIVEGSYILLIPAPQSAMTLLVRSQVRPGSLINQVDLSANANALQIQAVNLVGNNYVCTVPNVANNFITGTTDIVAGTPPFEHIALDEGSLPSAGTYTVPVADCIVAPQFGDWVELSDRSHLPQLPVELNPALARRTAAMVARQLGRLSQAQDLDNESNAVAQQALKLLAPRTEGSTRKITGGVAWGRRRVGFGYGW